MKRIIIFIIKLYQVTPLHSHNMCRFTPTCSNYMIDALNKYGTLKGLKSGKTYYFKIKNKDSSYSNIMSIKVK